MASHVVASSNIEMCNKLRACGIIKNNNSFKAFNAVDRGIFMCGKTFKDNL